MYAENPETSGREATRNAVRRRDFLRAGILSAASVAHGGVFSLLSDSADAAEKNENMENKIHPLIFSSENRSHVILHPQLAHDLNQCPAFGIEVIFVPRKITQSEATIIGNHHKSNGVFLRLDGGFLEFGVGTGSSYETVSYRKKVVADRKIKAGGVIYPHGIQLFVDDVEIGKSALEKPREEFKFPFMIGADPEKNGRDPQHYLNGEIHGVKIVAWLPSGKKRKNDPFVWQDVARYAFNGTDEQILRDVAKKYGSHDGRIVGAQWLNEGG